MATDTPRSVVSCNSAPGAPFRRATQCGQAAGEGAGGRDVGRGVQGQVLDTIHRGGRRLGTHDAVPFA